MNLTRRDFLKLCGAGAAAMGIGARFAPAPHATIPTVLPTGPLKSTGILIDTTKCIGCRTCQTECKKAHNLPLDDNPTGLSATTLCYVYLRNVSTDPSKPEIKPIKRQCMHCNHPGCVSACTVGALQKLPNGPVVYDDTKCIGCRYCMYACPFGVPTFEWDKQMSLISKCDQCLARQEAGKITACAASCPAGAIQFGSRSELLAMAHDRIDGNRTKYVDHIYGENEVGGTSVLYLASVPFERLGLPILPHEAPAEVSEEIMHLTPVVAGTVATTLTALYFATRAFRERRLQAKVHITHGGK